MARLATLAMVVMLVTGCDRLDALKRGGKAAEREAPAARKAEPPRDDPEPQMVGQEVTLAGVLVKVAGADPELLGGDGRGVLVGRWKGWDVFARFDSLEAMNGVPDEGEIASVRGTIDLASGIDKMILLSGCQLVGRRRR